MNKQITVNQHYVPQCLLKHFGWDAKKGKRINIFDSVRSTVRHNQSIKEVFSQNYFYDKDNLVENFISQKIESPASRIIDQIVSGNFEVISEDRLTLLAFISSLLYRTPEAREKAIAFVNAHFELMVRELLRLNGLDPEEASRGAFKFQDPSQVVSLIAVQGTIDSIILKDLDFHFVKNETNLEFYIADHPVFTYNWLYRNLDHPAVTSLTARGFQIFLPLSASLTLCLYDPKVYKYGQKTLASYISDVADIEILNSFQIMNSESIIGFHSKESESNLRQLYERNKNIKLYQFESAVVSVKENLDEKGEGEIKTTHLVLTRQTRLKKMPSFVKIKRKAKSYASSFHERDPELSAIHMDFKRALNEG